MEVYFTQFIGGCFIVWFLLFGVFGAPVCADNIYMGLKSYIFYTNNTRQGKKNALTTHAPNVIMRLHTKHINDITCTSS